MFNAHVDEGQECVGNGRVSFSIAHLFMQMKILNSTGEFNYNIYMTNHSKSSTGLIYANEESETETEKER